MSNLNNQPTPAIKRVISVGRMGSSSNDSIKDKKQSSDLHKLNTIRDYSFIDTLKRPKEKGEDLKDLFQSQSSELDSLNDQSYETHKINPLFDLEDLKSDSVYDNNNLISSAKNHITKIDVNQKTNIIPTQISQIYEKNKTNNNNNNIKTIFTNNNEKNLNFIKNDKNTNSKLIVKNEKLKQYDNLSLAMTNDEPIYMDPIEVLPQDQISRTYSIKSLDIDSFSQNNYYSYVSDSSSSIHDSPTGSSFRTNSTEFRTRKKSEILSEVKDLRNEMSQLFIFIDIKSTDLLYNLVIVNLYQKFWIGNLSSPTIGNYLHFGDQILNINGDVPNDLESLVQNVKNSKKSIFTLKLKRLPYGRIITISDIQNETFVSQTLDNEKSIEILKEKFGIKLKHNTAKIIKLNENGLFYKNGLKYDPNRVGYELETLNKILPLKKYEEKERLTKWVITEINSDYINYRCTAEEILARLKQNDTASVLIQPYDLVKSLFNQKKA